MWTFPFGWSAPCIDYSDGSQVSTPRRNKSGKNNPFTGFITGEACRTKTTEEKFGVLITDVFEISNYYFQAAVKAKKEFLIPL